MEWPEGRRFDLKARVGTLSWQRLKARSEWFELDGEVADASCVSMTAPIWP